MHCLRILLATAGLGAVMVVASACEVSSADAVATAELEQSAPDARGAWVEVDPGTVPAGDRVVVTAACDDSQDSATVRSDAFGTVTVRSSTTRLSASVQIPTSKGDGTYAVILDCRGGASARTTVVVVSSARPGKPHADQTLGPNTGGGFLAHSATEPDHGPTEPARSRQWLLGGAAALLAAAMLGARTLRAPGRPRTPTNGQPTRRRPLR